MDVPCKTYDGALLVFTQKKSTENSSHFFLTTLKSPRQIQAHESTLTDRVKMQESYFLKASLHRAKVRRDMISYFFSEKRRRGKNHQK